MPAPFPASRVTLSGLCWSAADGTPLFTDLDLTIGPGRTGLIGPNGSGKTTLLRLIAGDLAPRAGRIYRPERIGWLRQGLAPAPDQTVADLFDARAALSQIAAAEAGRGDAATLAGIDWTLPARLDAALAGVGLAGVAPDTPLTSLSGGEVTRARLAALVWAGPELLLLDEPTNHLDAEGRAAVAALLSGWRGAALVVSHDTALLDRMDAIVALTPQGVRCQTGNLAAFTRAEAERLAAARHDLAVAESARDRLAAQARQTRERKARRDGAGRRAHLRGGQPAVVLDARQDRAEASGGVVTRRLAARAAQAEADLTAARARADILAPLTMEIAPTGLMPGRLLVRLRDVWAGGDPTRPVLRGVDLTLTSPCRLALTGPNGSGKTTLLRVIAGDLAPFAGQVERPVAAALLDQDMALLDDSGTLDANFRRLNPDATAEESRAALARFRFRGAEALRRAGALSGGERLRAALACTLGRPVPPPLLLLDEPTNHLDREGVAALETALAAYDGALVVVSHDAAFLDRLEITARLGLAGQAGWTNTRLGCTSPPR